MTNSFSNILQARISRRGLLQGAAIATLNAALPLTLKANTPSSSLRFESVPRGVDVNHHVSAGYQAQLFLHWGDPLWPHSDTFTPSAQHAAAQATQLGYNHDYLAYFPINGSSRDGLLCINHEFTIPELMFPGGRKANDLTDSEHRIEMAAVGCSMMRISYRHNSWQPRLGDHLNRRIDANSPMRMSGPVAGHMRLCTTADPNGHNVLGTFANCAGGQTPWGTYLTCEENIDDYFWLGDYAGEQYEHHTNFGIGHRPYHRWDKVDARFNVAHEPNEPNRFGWVVEINPFDPTSTPKKRTALGRFKHESATLHLNNDGRIIVYTGDDEHFQYLYKYVSHGRYAAGEASDHLLDEGTLYVAQFHDDGTMQWLALLFGSGPLTQEHGFASQADVLLETRRAATLLGATPMDRPEDIAVHPKSGHVFASMTKNPLRLSVDAVNQQAPNLTGYIVELIPPAGDHTAARFGWELFLQGSHDTLACPDNVTFDARGCLWIATDGQHKAIGTADALYACEVAGPLRGTLQCLFRAPVGAEVTGPCFTPDQHTLFVSVQHPAEGSHYDDPSTRWPDFNHNMPPRPAIVAITKKDGGVIGG